MGARVHLCGRLQVEWDGERLEDELRGRQGRLLFAFLTLHRERPVRRDELVEALWSEAGPPPGGDALLRPPLSRLRTALGPGRLEGRAELAVRFPGDTWIDREAVRDGLRAGRAAYGAGDARGSWEAAREALDDRRAQAAPGPRGALARAVPGGARGAARRAARDGRAGRGAAGRRRAAGGRAGRAPGDPGGAVPRVRARGAARDAAPARQRRRGARRLRRVPHVPARRARHGAGPGAPHAARGPAARRAGRGGPPGAVPGAPRSGSPTGSPRR